MTVSVKDYGAIGNGVVDDADAIQAALDSGADEVIIPFGNYAVSRTLFVGSDTTVRADRCARIVMRHGVRRKRGDFLISNKNTKDGNVNIKLIGGIWDGNNTDPDMAKPDIFDMGGYSGAVINFVGVRGLVLSDLVVANSTTYYTRLCRVEDFVIENIDLVSDFFGQNQDGVHFGGGVRRGTVRNVRALSIGQTNDDMIAFNADDSVERVENLDLVRDDIEDITVENVFAVNCYTVFRMLSVDVNIRNITIKNVYAGYRNYVVNGDGARYCKTPLFCEADRPHGVGNIENVLIENLSCYPIFEKPKNIEKAQIDPRYAVRLECFADNFRISGFNMMKRECDPASYALLLTNVDNAEVVADGVNYSACEKADKILLDNFTELCVTKRK